MSSYRDLIAVDQAAKKLLDGVPWVLAGSLQEKDAFVRCLINESERLHSLNLGTKFSLITPLWNTVPRYVVDLVASCRLQTYADWELILIDDGSRQRDHLAEIEKLKILDGRIKLVLSETNKGISHARNLGIENASGDFVCILDHDDILHPQILGTYARIYQEDPLINFVYSNEVKISDDLSVVGEFCSKPAFCRSSLLRTNYICHFTAIKRDLLENVKTSNAEYFQSRFDGVEDHDLFLRIAGVEAFKPKHVGVFGYYWRMAPSSTSFDVGVKKDIWSKGREMLSEYTDGHIAVRGQLGKNELYSIHRKLRDQPIRVAVVIPFKDRSDLTLQCIDSLEKQDIAGRLKVVLVDNGSLLPETAVKLKNRIEDQGNHHDYVMAPCHGPFNYSHINNWAVTEHCSEQDFVVFLNNDVVLSSRTALAAMVAELESEPELGIVGLRLNFPDGSLQHGGMRLSMLPTKVFSPLHISGEREFVFDEHCVFAVTAACAVVRKSTFCEIGGFDERIFANGLSDVDLCCRILRSGKRVFYMGTLEAIHHESKTRKSQSEDLEVMLLNRRYGEVLLRLYQDQYGYNLVVPRDGQQAAWCEYPLRYRIADRLNSSLKQILGPSHRALKRLFIRS